MPRKSADSGTVIQVQPLVDRLPVPPSLDREEAEVWMETVRARESSYFDSDVSPVLEEYCRAVVSCRLLSRRIKDSEPDTDDKLYRLRDAESRRMAALAGKLRLTNQSRYTPKSAATAAKRPGGKVIPWQRSESSN